MARIVKPKQFGRVTVANGRQAAAAIERAIAQGKHLTIAKVDFTDVNGERDGAK